MTKLEAIQTCGRFDTITHARTQAELIDAIDDNIEIMDALIRDSVRTVAKYTKQRSALEQMRRSVE